MPAKGCGRQELVNGTGATRSGFDLRLADPQRCTGPLAGVIDCADGHHLGTIGREGHAAGSG